MKIAGEGVGDVVRFPRKPLGVMHDVVVEDEERCGAGNSQLCRSAGLGERRLPEPAGGGSAVALAEEHLEWGSCRPKEELHGKTHIGSEELKCVERHAANEIGWEEVAPRDARLKAM